MLHKVSQLVRAKRSMNMYEIVNLQSLIEEYLGPDREFLEYVSTNLNEPGENYGSLMLKVEIKVRNKATNEEETISAVAKTPPTDEIIQQIFNTKVTFKNEIAFYKTVIPTLQNLRKVHNIEPATYFPEFVGARLNLNGTEQVDSDAVLLLENLTIKGFTSLSRHEGYSLQAAKLVLKDLADFHGNAIALRSQKPQEFKSKIEPYLDGVFFEGQHSDENLINQTLEQAVVLMKEKGLVHLIPKVTEILSSKVVRSVRGPFTTISHTDLWINNTMLRQHDSVPVDIKLVDFQVCRYQTPADDLLFFLFTSVQDDVLDKNLDILIRYYYDLLIVILKKFNCKLDVFSWEAFEAELLYSKDLQFWHCAWMYYPIFMDKGATLELEEHKFEMSARHKEKLYFLIKQFD